MTATATTHETEANQSAAEGRNPQGRFVQGNKGGPGNPFARKVAQLRAALVNFITEDDMKHLCFVLKMRAEGGDMVAMKLLFQYVLGKPTETVDPDRLDVDEWQKMQENSRPPEEATKVLGGLPVETVCEVTKVAWPCAVEQAFKQPMLEGLRAMDERGARLSATKAHGQPSVGLQAEESPPSPKRDNGPTTNNPGGAEPDWWIALKQAASAERAARRRGGRPPSPNGGNGQSG